jgi:hypothetical protein
MILSSNGGQATFTKSVIFMIFNTYAHHYTVQFIQNFKHLVFVFGTWGADYASPSFDSSWQVDLEPPGRAMELSMLVREPHIHFSDLDKVFFFVVWIVHPY